MLLTYLSSSQTWHCTFFPTLVEEIPFFLEPVHMTSIKILRMHSYGECFGIFVSSSVSIAARDTWGFGGAAFVGLSSHLQVYAKNWS